MGAFCCHGNQSFDPIFPKTLYSLSPTPVMLHITFDQDWPTGFRDIQVWRCGRRTDDGPLVYYKLTLWAFGSGELKSPWRAWITASSSDLASVFILISYHKIMKKKNQLKHATCCACLCFFFFISLWPSVLFSPFCHSIMLAYWNI